MPGPTRPDDEADLIRTEQSNLQSPDWWSQFALEGVVLYSWGAPRYTAIAKAIKASGAKLVINLDSEGIFSPLVSPIPFVRLCWRSARSGEEAFTASLRLLARLLRSIVPPAIDLPRLRHLSLADLIGTVSPEAGVRTQRYARFFGFHELASKIHFVPHPVSPTFHYSGSEKEDIIIAIGRWCRADAAQKNPRLLIASAADLLRKHLEYRLVVVGSYDNLLERCVAKLPESTRSRIFLAGGQNSGGVKDFLNSSRISLCASHDESFHIASAEALCSGCSVVSHRSPLLPSMEYFTSENSGTLADAASPDKMSAAVEQEIRAWEGGRRDPQALSETWTVRLHAHRVAERILDLVEGRITE